MERLNIVHLSLGSDLGDKLSFLKKAITEIKDQIGDVVKISSVYKSEAWGFQSQTTFYNIAIELETKLDPLELLVATQQIENEIGRGMKSHEGQYESRIIDIDIIFYNDLVISSKKLTIPHPHFHLRNFVLFPLSEIAANTIDPKTSLNVRQLLHNSQDKSKVNVIVAHP